MPWRPQRPSVRWLALVLVLVAACRKHGPSAERGDWKPSAGTPAEVGALLLLDRDGRGKVACLPGGGEVRPVFPGMALESVLDVAWRQGLMVAGQSAHQDDRQLPIQELVLVLPNGDLRVLAKGCRTARFSPDATALAYEVATPVGQDGATNPASFVLDLSTGKVTELGALADPLWESDSKHVRATMLRKGRVAAGRPSSLRVRWARESGALAIDGPGSAQIPSPVGDAVAWSEAEPGSGDGAPCTVYLTPHAGVKHSVVGRYCMGIADDRALRWSPDGRWLAFAHPAQQKLEAAFVDVVSPQGGRSPALSALRTHAPSSGLAMTVGPGPVWFDWSPSSHHLALGDGLEIRVYDFETKAVISLGKGQRPTWSPGGTYLSILAAGDAAGSALVLAGTRPGDPIGLGQARDARWLPAEACARSGAPR